MDFFEALIRDFQENESEAARQVDTNTMFEAYENFENAIRQLYGNPNEVREAAQKLDKLSQTGSAAEYLSKFQQIASKIHWDEPGLIHRFYQGLKEEVKDEIAKEE